MATRHHVVGWSDYAGMFDDIPYTIVIGKGASARKSVRQFAGDGAAIRWMESTLADHRDGIRIYRGQRPRGKPMMEVRALKA